MNLAPITFQDVIGKQISATTRKNYESSIRQMRAKMTPEESLEYLDPRGLLIKPLHHEVGSRILHECQVRHNGDASGPRLKSQNTAVLYCSAMKYWHKESNRMRDTDQDDPVIISHDQVTYLASYTTGRRRITAEERANGEESECEGKYPIDLREFKSLAKIALAAGSRPKDARLFHAYLISCWNLIARSSTVGDLLWNNIGWLDDCITVLYEKGKTNQEGMNKVPWHVYANPGDPLICPILALGLKLCTETDTFGNRPFKVFPSSTPDNTFSSWMRKSVDELAQDPEILLSVPADRVGTHSLRKGAATYVDGQCDGPHTDAIKLRMEHKLAGCDYRYIFRGSGNDGFVGRSVSGLDTCSFEMGSLPPHFKHHVEVSSVISQAIISRANNNLKRAFPYLVASVIYHWEWLQTHLPETHPFFYSRIYTSGIYQTWKPFVIAGIFKCPETGMIASGLPRSMTILLETRLIQESLKNVPDITAEKVIDKLSSVQNIYIHSSEVLNRTITPRIESMERSITSLLQANEQLLAQAQSPILSGSTTSQFRRFFWDDTWHAHPKTFQIPADTCLKVWNLWLFGDATEVNTPYRCLEGASITASGKTRLSRAKKVFDGIQKEIGLSYEALTIMGHVEAERKFLEAFTRLFGHIRNYSNMQLSNAYKHDLRARRRTTPNNSRI